MNYLKKILKTQAGVSLIETVLAVGAVGVGALALASMGSNSAAQMAGIEWKIAVEQYKIQTMTQFLASTNNCKCLFQNMEMTKQPSQSIAEAGDANTLSLGVWNNNCTNMPNPYLTNTFGPDGIRITAIKIKDVDYISNSYFANMAVSLETNKKVLGQNQRTFKIPIILNMIDGSTPTQARIESCGSTAKNESSFKLPPIGGGAGWQIPLNPASGSFHFSAVPATASGVFIQWTIGTPSNGRSDRNCDITGRGINIKLGTDSKGDGGQKMVAGSAYVPLDGCTTPRMNYSCQNNNNRGEFRVVAYVDDGNAPTCGGTVVSCTAPLVSDGAGNCVTPSADGDDCAPGFVYNASLDTCVAQPCVAPEVEISPGVCFDPSSFPGF
jgi:hypothetical protein